MRSRAGQKIETEKLKRKSANGGASAAGIPRTDTTLGCRAAVRSKLHQIESNDLLDAINTISTSVAHSLFKYQTPGDDR
jgi:hypothetical protein